MNIRTVEKPQFPRWVEELFGDAPHRVERLGNAITVRRRVVRDFASVELTWCDAIALKPEVLSESVREAYGHIHDVLRISSFHPVRWWNYVPGIRRRVERDQDAYMAFNAGREAAFREWPKLLATETQPAAASGVGNLGRDLCIHLLAARRPGTPVHNPRQKTPSKYSMRYGPHPPRFARGTKVPTANGSSLLMISGTASVLGEDTAHLGDLQLQFQETLRNLSVVIHSGTDESRSTQIAAGEHSHQQQLDTLAELRAYLPRPGDIDWFEGVCRHSLSHVSYVEVLITELCRPDLLVEIEAVALIGETPNLPNHAHAANAQPC